MEILENDYNQFHEHLPEFISKKGVLRVENSWLSSLIQLFSIQVYYEN